MSQDQTFQVPAEIVHISLGLFRMVDSIARMNKVYDLPLNNVPQVPTSTRLKQFKEILLKEVAEIDDIIADVENYETDEPHTEEAQMVLAAALADLTGDLVVYCVSEMMRHGYPFLGVMESIMHSNFSKLGEDGRPIKDPKLDKFLKGPNYEPPEPSIYSAFMAMREAARQAAETTNLRKAGVIIPGVTD